MQEKAEAEIQTVDSDEVPEPFSLENVMIEDQNLVVILNIIIGINFCIRTFVLYCLFVNTIFALYNSVI